MTLWTYVFAGIHLHISSHLSGGGLNQQSFYHTSLVNQYYNFIGTLNIYIYTHIHIYLFILIQKIQELRLKRNKVSEFRDLLPVFNEI